MIAASAYSEHIYPGSTDSIVSVASNKARTGFSVMLDGKQSVWASPSSHSFQRADDPAGPARHMSSTRHPDPELIQHYRAQTGSDIFDELLKQPEDYSVSAAQGFSGRTRIQNIHVRVERVTRHQGYPLRFEGSLEVAIELNVGDGDLYMNDHYPGTVIYEIDQDGGCLVRASVDTSSFYD